MNRTIKCPRCGGTGKVPDNAAVGASMRKAREKAKVSLRTMAAQMQFSPPYLSDLERGRRGWNTALMLAYRQCLAEIRRVNK